MLQCLHLSIMKEGKHWRLLACDKDVNSGLRVTPFDLQHVRASCILNHWRQRCCLFTRENFRQVCPSAGVHKNPIGSGQTMNILEQEIPFSARVPPRLATVALRLSSSISLQS